MLHPIVTDYINARCNARVASDRYKKADAIEYGRQARRAYADGNRATWPQLDAARRTLDSDLSLTDATLAASRTLESLD